MIATIVSLIIALFFLFSPFGQIVATAWSPISVAIAIVSSIFLLLLPLVQALSWSSLQRAEKQLTPRLMELKKHDSSLKISTAWLIIFPLLSIVFGLIGNAFDIPLRTIATAVWIFLFGFSLDIFQHFIKRLMSYLNPYAVLGHFSHAAKVSIQNDKELDLCDVVDALTEMATKAVQQSGTALSLEVLGKMQEIYRHFLEASKSLTHHQRDSETEKMGISDKISYTLFYFLQRLELINRLAADKLLEPVCSSTVTTLGKMALHSAKFDISLGAYPIETLGKCAILDQQHQMPEVGVKATITLLEVAKTILDEVDITYLELKDTYTAIVSQMSAIAKEAFKQDKTLNIPLLKQPFLQLRELCKSDKMAVHLDTPVINDSIDRAVAEFDALEMVMRAIPPIPTLPPEEKPS